MKDMLTVSTIITDKNYNEFEKSIADLIRKIAFMSDEEDHLTELLLILNNDTSKYENKIKEIVHNIAVFSPMSYDIDEEKLENISIKIVKTHKLSKDYALFNLAWQAGSGDIVVFHESIAVLRDELKGLISVFENDAQANGAFIYYNQQSDFQQAAATPNRARLYKDINQSYSSSQEPKSILPLSSRGWIANRKMINDAFSSQSEHYEPYIALAISGLDRTEIAVDANADSSNQTDYKKSHREELKAMYASQHHNRFTSLISRMMILTSVMSLFLILSHVDLISWEPSQSISIAALSIIVILICMIVISFARHLRDMLIIQKQTLAASLNKSVVGQFEINKVL